MAVDKNALLTEVTTRHKPPVRTRTLQNGSSWGGGTPTRPYVYILYGFVLGFVLAFATLPFNDGNFIFSEVQHLHTVTTEIYQTDCATTVQDVLVEEETTMLEQLEQEVRVLCLVLTCPKYHELRAAHVRATWGQRCSKLVFVSSETNEELGAVSVVAPEQDTYENLWNKTYLGFQFAYENYLEDYDWFLKADDDTYIVMENLRYILYAYPNEMALMFGNKFIEKEWNIEYMSGGASYVLSKEALRRMIEHTPLNETFCYTSAYPEDLCLGYVMEENAVQFIDSRFALPAEREPKFFPLSLTSYVNPNRTESLTEWLTNMTPYPIETGLDCCSKYTVAIHYMQPEDMYLHEFLIYKLQAFGRQRAPEKLPPRMSFEDAIHFIANNYESTTTN